MIENLEIKRQFYEQLDEYQKRLFLGMEAIRLGKKGVRLVSKGFDVHPHTVRRGKKELTNPCDTPRVKARQSGGGRKKR